MILTITLGVQTPPAVNNNSEKINMECFTPLKSIVATWTAVVKTCFEKPDTQSTAIPDSIFVVKCHPLVNKMSREVDDYFLEHWPFPTERSRKHFVKAGFSRVTCLYFPLSKNDRIGYACRLLTVLFLIDGRSYCELKTP